MDSLNLTRRQLLRHTPPAVLAMAGLSGAGAVKHDTAEQQDAAPVRAITRGPKFHWFAYYDKLQFDPASRCALGMEVGFEHRSPTPDDTITLGMVDLKDNNRWTELGRSSAWCWQQGCMLQWRPGSTTEILYNDRQDGRFVAHVLDVKTRKRRTLPHPFYTISPDGRIAVAPDFARVDAMRPGYGYKGLPDPYQDDLAPRDSGIFRIDLETGKQVLIISLVDIARFGKIPGEPKDAKHYFNHLLFSPDGSRFIFLHRWKPRGPSGYENVGGFGTRMLTASPDGSDIRIVDPHGKTSHFIWRDPAHILAWAWHPSAGNAFYLYKETTGAVEVVGKGVMTTNGHCSYLPSSHWILNDTYPDSNRNQNVYLYNVRTARKVPLASFYLPPEYMGEWRCDTHPRFSPDGRNVCIDSAHEGKGRQMYLIDISRITRPA